MERFLLVLYGVDAFTKTTNLSQGVKPEGHERRSLNVRWFADILGCEL